MKKDTSPTVAITGASGFLGTKLCNHFLNRGWRVIALVRDTQHQTKKHTRLEYRPYDITKPLRKNTLASVSHVIHAAYVKVDGNPDAFEQNIIGAKNLLAATNEAGVTQLLFVSTMSAHSDAISIYGKQKLAIENLFLETQKATVLRCGLIVGNGGIVREMATFMKSKHAVPLIGGGAQPLQIIAVDDLSQTIENAFTKKIIGRLVAANPRVYTYREFYKHLAKALNVSIVYIPVPYWTLQAAFKTASAMRIPLGVGEDNLKGLKKLTAMPSDKDMETLDVKPIDLDAALDKIYS